MKKNFVALGMQIVYVTNDEDILTTSGEPFGTDAADNDFTLQGGWGE